MLEQTVSLDGPLVRGRDSHGLRPVPIRAAWVLDGEPRAREKALARSTDGCASVHMWDCSSGRFKWHYAAEEIVHVLEGCATVEVGGGARRLQPGDTHVFSAGSQYRWTVPDYVRTVTFRLPFPAPAPLKRRLQAALTAPWGQRSTRTR